ncbi:MAG TPA: hypothetical protein VF173_27370 [Thermoanaerobaculia bacterium]|nr:hypothetical protein [Thermoanaerobaculia bacterium]
MRAILSRGMMLLLVLFLLGSTAASAGVLLTSARTTNPFNFTYAPGGSSPVPIALNDAGATSLTFSTASTQTVVVTFSGECSGNTAGTWVVAVIVIDGVTANGDGFVRYTRLCAGSEPQKAISRTVFKSVSAGNNHTIQILAAVEGPLFAFYSGVFEKTVLAVTN